METKIIFSNFSHLDFISKCHINSFPSSLSSAMGLNYVKSMLSWYFSSDKVFLFHIENRQSNIIGFCGGIIVDGTLSTGSTSGMAQHSFKAAIFAFLKRPWLFFHKELRSKWPVIFRNIMMKLGILPRRHFNDEQIQIMTKEPSIGLVVIAVDPIYQGKGYGSLLLKEFERIAVEKYGIFKLKLSVNSNNLNALRVYENNGWLIDQSNNDSFSLVKIINN